MAAELKSWKTLVGLLIAGVALQAPRVRAAELEVDGKEAAEAKQMIEQMPPSAEKDMMLKEFDTFERDAQDGKVNDPEFTKDVEKAAESPAEGGKEAAGGEAATHAGAAVEAPAHEAATHEGAAVEAPAHEAAAPEAEKSSPAENTTDSALDHSAENAVTVLSEAQIRTDEHVHDDGTLHHHAIFQHSNSDGTVTEHDHGDID